MSGVTEATVEAALLEWFGGMDYTVLHGPDIAPDAPGAERTTYSDVLLMGRLRDAVRRLNPTIPPAAQEDALRKVAHVAAPTLSAANRAFHLMLTNGVDVQYKRSDGTTAGDKVWLLDFDNPANNDWVALNQFTITENRRNRRPDVLVYVNGLPLAIVELKNPNDEKATLHGAYNQLQTYKTDIASLFPYNEIMVVSNGIDARAGTLTGDWERFAPWRTIDGSDAPTHALPLDVLTHGIFDKERFLDLVRFFIVFETDGQAINKKLAAYHQYHAVNKAVRSTLAATHADGDKRAGVIWHTQGSGKSLSMAFYAGKIIAHPQMVNPTLVVLTDRNDLDDQLFQTFSLCHDLLRQQPQQAEHRDDLRNLLRVGSGGVVFTTIQKFLPDKGERYPLLSERRNIVVIADEAHRSQYDFIDGYARHLRDALPNASFIGFTGTPLEAGDKSTPAVFGEYVDIYDIQQAVADGATVRIYYEARMARLELKPEERPKIDPNFETVTEGEEVERKEKLKSKWARLEAMVGTPTRIAQIAQDIVTHFEARQTALAGKGMIVCMSRRICVDLYEAIIWLRPQWADSADDRGALKVVMTGDATDPAEWQPHIRTSKARRDAIAKRFKNADDPLQLVIVRDMWLTGFDVPSLHTMYVDKPMQGLGLMQAIARVNRVFKDKPGGLIVDYLGIADRLKEALAVYTERDRGQTGIPQEQAVAIMLAKYEIVCDMFYGFDFAPYLATPAAQLGGILPAMQHILTGGLPSIAEEAQQDRAARFMAAVADLSKAFALAVPHEQALAIRDAVGFFQLVRSAFAKNTIVAGKSDSDLDSAVRQLVSKAVASPGIVDLFAAAGLKTPDISILSDEFLAEVRDLPQRNVALELLKKLVNDEIKVQTRKNVVQARAFSTMLDQTIKRYQNRSIEVAEVIAELIRLAEEMREAHRRGEAMGLADEELAFYDALETNDSAVKILGDSVLRLIAHDLVVAVRNNVTIDWTEKENVRAKMRVMIKRILRKHGYPPDKEERATLTVMEQAEVLCRDWAG